MDKADNMDELVEDFETLRTNDESRDVSGGAKKKTQTGGKTKPVNKREAFKGSVTCKDEDNEEVDWFILYKTPSDEKKKTPKNQDKGMTGLDYVYIYPDQEEGRVMSKRNNKPINDPNGILANTLRPLFTDNESLPSDFGFIIYNDQPPVGYSARVRDPTNEEGGPAPDTFGHSKGVVMMQKNGTGVWLLHSTPNFPYKRDPNNFWPESGTQNAQIFIGVTFNYDQFRNIGKHLQYIKAFPFDSHFPQTLNLNELQEVTTKKTKEHNTPTKIKVPSKLQPLMSRGGKEFHSIAKQRSDEAEDGDLYITIAKIIKSDVFVQSWGGQKDQHEPFIASDGKELHNIGSVKTELGEWEDVHDHSKWCVARDPKTPWTCIGDVNRAEKQYKRLGGALCVKDEEIWKIFRKFIMTVYV